MQLIFIGRLQMALLINHTTAMSSILLTFCYISCFLSLLCFMIVLIQNKFRLYSKILILACIFSCLLVIFFWTFFQGAIPLLSRAHLWVFILPLYYLPGSLLYLYVKSVLKEKSKKISRLDLLHFFPMTLAFIGIIPYTLSSLEIKRHSLTQYLLHPETVSDGSVFLLPLDLHIMLTNILWMVYILATVYMLFKFKKKAPLWIARNKHLWFWITRLTFIDGLCMIMFIAAYICFDMRIFLKVLIAPTVIFMLNCMVILMFNPKIFYGFNNQFSIDEETNSGKTEQTEIVAAKTLELSPLKIEEYKIKTIAFISENKVFLKKNYSLKEMSCDLEIPLHHLSFLINNEFGTNYAGFINKYRIDYIIEHRFDEEWSHFSLEGIGAEAGFNSRNTFFKAFKIATGQTPSEYFKKNTANEAC